MACALESNPVPGYGTLTVSDLKAGSSDRVVTTSRAARSLGSSDSAKASRMGRWTGSAMSA